MAQPDDLGRAAANIEYDRIRKTRVQQRRAAGYDQPRLLGGRDDLDLDPDLVAHARQEVVAIDGAPARLGRDIAADRDLALTDLAGAYPQSLDRARHGRLGQSAARREPLAKPDDPRKRIDDPEPAGAAPRNQQPAIVRTEIERSVARWDRPCGRRKRAPSRTPSGAACSARNIAGPGPKAALAGF